MTDQLDRAILRALDRLLTETPELGPAPAHPIVGLDDRRRRPSGRLVAAVATCLVLVSGVAVALVESGGSPASPSDTIAPAFLRGYVPAETTDGYTFSGDVVIADAIEMTDSDGYQVYGEVDGDLHAIGLIGVETQATNTVSCAGESSTVEVDGRLASLCISGNLTRLTWTLDEAAVAVTAGKDVTVDQLTSFAAALALTPRNNPPPDGVPVLATPTRVPNGWGLLWDNDSLLDATNTIYGIATTGSTGSNPSARVAYSVTIWHDVGAAAPFAVDLRLDLDELGKINGHAAYTGGTDSSNPYVMWMPEPDTLLIVETFNGTVENLQTFARGLTPAEPAEFAKFLEPATTSTSVPRRTEGTDPVTTA